MTTPGTIKAYDFPVTSRRAPLSRWLPRALILSAAGVTLWVLFTRGSAVAHGHLAYAVMVALTALGAAAGSWRIRRSEERSEPGPPRRIAASAAVLVIIAWIGLVAWLRPFAAQETAVRAMVSDPQVQVTESATRIVLAPTVGGEVGVLFQPGARVEARAYAAALRPLAEDGHLVVIVKQPLGIAFTAAGALEAARSDHPGIGTWIVGGHSLGGTVAAQEATGERDGAPAAGLFLWASYPAGDISFAGPVTSISGTDDQLATPEKIEASRADLPVDTTYTAVDGASHAQFGDYGPQPGDGTPSLGADEARRAIVESTLSFVATVDAGR
ncbi:MAG: alpha/beta hydrolase [Propioniciclava sp.]